MVDCCLLSIDLLNFKRSLVPVHIKLEETLSSPPTNKPPPPLLRPLNDGQEYLILTFQCMKMQRWPRTTRFC